jgi:SAM-dependent methyltransferase
LEVHINPLQFAASITADFVRLAMKNLPPAPSLLDVGCGDGLIAAQLIKDGTDVFAIDGNEQCVQRADEIGVKARHCLLLDLDHSPFDLIYVSRALHHMPPLAETLNKLESLLRPTGVLVIEDFGFELVDRTAAAWLIEQTRRIQEKTIIASDRHKWLIAASDMSPEQASELWQQHHWTKHKLLTSEEMKKELFNQFEIDYDQSHAYLFRYLCDLLPETTDGAWQAREICRQESDLAAAGRLPAVGFRSILRKK